MTSQPGTLSLSNIHSFNKKQLFVYLIKVKSFLNHITSNENPPYYNIRNISKNPNACFLHPHLPASWQNLILSKSNINFSTKRKKIVQKKLSTRFLFLNLFHSTRYLTRTITNSKNRLNIPLTQNKTVKNH